MFAKIISIFSLKIKQVLHIASHNYLLHITPARGPPGWDDVMDQTSCFDSEPQFEPDYDVDQTVKW